MRNIAVKIVLIMTLMFLLLLPTIRAEEVIEDEVLKFINEEEIDIYSDKDGTSPVIGKLDKETIIELMNDNVFKNEEDESCSEWFYLEEQAGYVCKGLFKEYEEKEEPHIMTDEEFDEYLNNEGFNDTYKDKLKAIHKLHPTWVFKSIITNRDWNSTVNAESQLGYSTYYMDAVREAAGQEAYLSTASHYDWNTDVFYGYDGSFFLANKETVQYFLDPRNFLNEVNIFMFESLYFDKDYQTEERVTSILGTNKYSKYIYEAGEAYNYSPIAIAVKIRQEGTLNRRVTSGTISVRCNPSFLYEPDNGTLYLGPLYNFYNIGAYTRATDADLNGLCYAAKTNETYLLPWNSEERAIKGGAKWISSQYVQIGQFTNYLQKYNVGTANSEIWHQYMTNIEDPKSESYNLYNLYKNAGLLDTNFVFYIPIFNDMPDKTELPQLGNPNNWLKEIIVEYGNTKLPVSNFKGNTTEYTVTVPNNINDITINTTTVAKTSYVSINKSDKRISSLSLQLPVQEVSTTFEIVVTSSNNNEKTYLLTIVKEDPPIAPPKIIEMIDNINLKTKDSYIHGITYGLGAKTLIEQLQEQNKYASISVTDTNEVPKENGALATGDKIVIKNDEEEFVGTIVLYGDVNGDGDITNLDLLRIQRYLWKDITLEDVYFEASDVNHDNTITNLDLLRVQKHIWKDLVISQD